jgi:hypothetical protein
VTTSCYIFLIIMGLVLFLGGSLLSVIAFVPQQKKEWTYDLHKSSKTPVVGPLLVCIGVIITIGGITLAVINKKLRNGGRLITRSSSPYQNFSNNSSFCNVQSHIQQHSPDRCFSINHNSLTLESLTQVIGHNSSPTPEETSVTTELSIVAIISGPLTHKEETLRDIACFPTSEKEDLKMTKKTKLINTPPPLLDIPEIYITQASPIPRLQSYARTKKRRRNSFRLRHKVTHDIGASTTSSQLAIEIPATRRASFHGDSLESPEQRPRSSSPKSLPLIISLYDTYLSAKSRSGERNSEPDTGDSIEDKEWIWGDRTGSPTVDTDSIRINLDKLQE